MTWENTTRRRRLARRRSDYHQQRIKESDTTKQKLSAACQWLISEAWSAGLVEEVHQWVLQKVHDVRKEEQHHDRDDHAA